jgi:hypothetical protein
MIPSPTIPYENFTNQFISKLHLTIIHYHTQYMCKLESRKPLTINSHRHWSHIDSHKAHPFVGAIAFFDESTTNPMSKKLQIQLYLNLILAIICFSYSIHVQT